MKTVNVVAAVICDSMENPTKIFATQRGYGDYKGGWEFPGGKVEVGESAEDALAREIREELDTEIEVGKYIDTIEWDYPTFHLSMRCYWSCVKSGNLVLKEHAAAKWLTADTLDSVNWLPADITILDKIREVLTMDQNIEYYNKNAESFFAGTVNADMSLWRNKFESYIPDGSRVLDAGCGSGRDSRAFKQHGYSVVAFDASSEMCRMASELIGQQVWQMRFDEIPFDEEFDGIWACASLLHVPNEELPDVLSKLYKALKDNGALYVSFKYGEGRKQRGDRTFSDFTEESVKVLLDNTGFEVVECGVSTDIRPDRAEEKWVNVIAKICNLENK